MSKPSADFWKILGESHLLSPEECQQWSARFTQAKGPTDRSTAKAVAQWLVSQNALTRYQAALLLAGRSGPFFYGDYKVLERIDGGRFGGQFRAVHFPTNHPVQLQFVTGPYVQDPRYWQMVVAQTQATGAVNPQNLRRVFEAFDTGTFKFLVVENLAGESLEDVLTRVGRLPPQDACYFIRQVALGLAQLHQLGQPHGDIRPENLWLEPTGNIKLIHDPSSFPAPINFAAEDQAPLQAKADYFAPEFVQQGKTPDGLTDIYALGCTFYQLLAGQPPFAGGMVMQKLGRHAAEPIQPLDSLGVPPSVMQLVAYMMAKNPAVRFQQAGIVAEQLMAFVEPSKLYSQPAPQPATQGNFEAYIRSRPPVMLPQPTPQPAPAPPAPAAASPAQTPGQPSPPTGAVPMGTAVPNPSAAAVATPKVPVVSVGPSFGDITTPGEPIASRPITPRKTLKNDPQKLAIVLGSVGAGIIALLFLLNGGSGSRTEPNGEAVTQGTTGITPTSNNPLGKASSDPTKQKSNGTSPQKGGGIESTPGTDMKSPTAQGPASPGGPGKIPTQIVQADNKAEWEKLLWASPTSGKEIDFQYVPPGSHLFIVLRPHDILSVPDGSRVLEAMGPTFKSMRESWERAAGVRWEEVEQLIVGLYQVPSQFPRPTCIVRLKHAVPKEEMLAKWGNPAEGKEGNYTIYNGAGWTYFIPPKGEDKLFVMGDAADIKESVASNGAPPPMRREMEKLRKTSDADRHMTLFFAPNFLFNDLFPEEGRKLYFGDAKRVREPLEWFLSRDELQAGAVSAHFAGEFYLEMRMIGNLSKEKFQLASEFRKRIEQIPGNVEKYVAKLGSNPYWELIRVRLDNMIQFLYDHTRVGVDDDVAMINCVLPPQAAHNLVFGSEMLLVSAPGVSTVASGPAKPAAPAFASADEVVMKHKTKMGFESQSLEFALQDLEKDVKEALPSLPFEFKIKILGDDLKLDGITRNMTVRDFKAEGTVADVLTAMVMKTTTAKEPTSPDLKLIWVVDKDPEDANKRIVLLTTRQMSEKRKYQVPAVFVAK